METNNISTEYEINNLISTKAEESTYLEFKSGEALKNEDSVKKEISKDISAFANSDGGTIIYGIIEKNNVASDLSFINGNILTKEWLVQVISSRIQRKIEGLEIEPIRFQNQIDKTVYIVKIPRSLNAPHMASDNRFYKRTGSICRIMEEYEVRDLYTRQESTKLEIADPKIIGAANTFDGIGKILDYIVKIDFEIENKGQTIEKLYKVEIRIPKQIHDVKSTYDNQTFEKHFARKEDDYFVYSIPNSSPIFQKELATVGIFKFSISKSHFNIITKKIKIKLFYSCDIVEKMISFNEDLKYKDRELLLEDFSQFSR